MNLGLFDLIARYYIFIYGYIWLQLITEKTAIFLARRE